MHLPNTLDRTDLNILRELQTDGRVTNKDLAERVNLSPSACHQRMQKLISEGWIDGFVGNINIDRLCAPVQCITTISLGNHSPEAFRFVERRVMALPEALEAYTVSGSCDFFVRIACAQMSQYMQITNTLLNDCPEISNISTHVIMKQSKMFGGYPLKEMTSQKDHMG